MSLHHEELAATVTDIAYQALLQHGLRRSFVDVELDLWRQIRSALASAPRPTTSSPGILA